MQQKKKKGLAFALSAVFVASTLLNTFAMSAFAQDQQSEPVEQITAQIQQEDSSAVEQTEEPVLPTDEPSVEQPEETEEPIATQTPMATSVPAETATPEPSETPMPTAEPKPSETPMPTVEPKPSETPVPTAEPTERPALLSMEEESEELTMQDVQKKVQELLEKSTSVTELSESELEKALEEIDQLTKKPLVLGNSEEEQEVQKMLDQLVSIQPVMEDMRMAWQAKREGWLDQLPQTGKENSWRYQNGERIDPQISTMSIDLPAGARTFSANGHKGIDVSHHQGVINWEAVKASGVEFAVIRCGFGMNISEQDDRQWSRNVSECERLGIPYGVYFYSYAVTSEMAVDEAAHALRLLEGHHPDLPVFYDMEENRQLVVGNDGLAEIARIFCDTVSSKGYEVGVYASLNWWNHYLTSGVFENWHRWIAEWRSSCSYNGRYEMWQYTNSGSVSGINGNVDMNYWYGSLSETESENEYKAIYDYKYYVSHYSDLAGYTQEQALEHFIKHGMAEGRQGNKEFNVYNYRARYADLMDWLGNDLQAYYIHYKDHGKAEGRDAQNYCRLSRYNGQDYSAVYDYDYYIQANADIRNYCGYSDYLTLQHFVEHGMAEGRQGNKEFNVYNYRARYADLMDWLGNDLQAYYIHYKDHGKAEGRDAQNYCRLTRYNGQDYSAVYNYDYYVQANSDIRNYYGYSDYLTLQHFVEHGMAEGRQGSAEFNVYNYRARYADLMDWLGNDLQGYYIHYKDHGKAEGRDAQSYCRLTRYNGQDYSAVYDYDYYVQANDDIRNYYGYSDYLTLQHFVEHGMAEGRQGSEEFNVYSYRARYTDLMEWLGNDLQGYYIHYKDHGKAEGRDAQSYCRLTWYNGQDYSAVYNYDYYVQANSDIRNYYGYSDYLTLQHFVEHGMAEGRQGSEEFNVYSYQARYADLAEWLGNDLRGYYIHYKDHGKEEGRVAVGSV